MRYNKFDIHTFCPPKGTTILTFILFAPLKKYDKCRNAGFPCIPSGAGINCRISLEYLQMHQKQISKRILTLIIIRKNELRQI